MNEEHINGAPPVLTSREARFFLPLQLGRVTIDPIQRISHPVCSSPEKRFSQRPSNLFAPSPINASDTLDSCMQIKVNATWSVKSHVCTFFILVFVNFHWCVHHPRGEVFGHFYAIKKGFPIKFFLKFEQDSKCYIFVHNLSFFLFYRILF